VPLFPHQEAVLAKTIAILVGPEYEDLEVWYPKLRLEAAGFAAPLVGAAGQTYRGKHGYPAPTERSLVDVDPADLAGVLAPGGWAPDKLRRDPAVLDLVRAVHSSGALVATICHGPWILISAGIVRGRTLTSTVGIRDDLVNAGAEWKDAEVVVDGNIISSRVPRDLPAFGEAMVDWLAKRG
jgi:protease I